ncbi:RsmB/NOP family class I SAM-dependent RNA methyltransferase [Candidatus Protochlamydia phocaeensis]|uniref:RsmB/NOP family class I SAM-dependent RNA methyltransferase n=1 Tax=Candidatus Protochlamydia phocaeensis TaxID=1414722 RepID=UPI0009ADBE54|nr:RsmB/NOP family class I SAM-dependent RNA methyltransferase [Candidatus Protochlamydia phocaeensis]
MNNIPFRPYHLFALLNAYNQQTLPLDLFISHYFRAHPALGSKDRAFIAETIYALIRWQALLDYLSPEDHSWESRYRVYEHLDLEQILQREDIPLHIRVSFPLPLFQLMENSYGSQRTIDLCLTSNKPAPTTVRVNTLKTTREELLKLWEGLYEVSPTSLSPYGIQFHKKINFFSLPEFKAGFFEVQDEGSQLLAQLVKVQPGDQVLDYCAGSGGKTLAFAPAMQHTGQIYVHDIRPYALQEARKRLKRAGIQNSQILLPDSPHLAKLKKKMNWVLVDAPCTGTGTLRRNPDMKWKFDEHTLARLIGQQRMIFERALSFLRPDGRIVYGTCSILKEENQQQLEHFLKTYQLRIEGDVFQSFPAPGGMDGFFGVVLKRI